MKTKINTILFTGMPAVIGILVVLEIVISNQFAGSGKEILSVNNQIIALSDENSRTEEMIASYSSFMAISDRASQLGYIQPKSSQYVTIVPDQLPVALRTSP